MTWRLNIAKKQQQQQQQRFRCCCFRSLSVISCLFQRSKSIVCEHIHLHAALEMEGYTTQAFSRSLTTSMWAYVWMALTLNEKQHARLRHLFIDLWICIRKFVFSYYFYFRGDNLIEWAEMGTIAHMVQMAQRYMRIFICMHVCEWHINLNLMTVFLLKERKITTTSKARAKEKK